MVYHTFIPHQITQLITTLALSEHADTIGIDVRCVHMKFGVDLCINTSARGPSQKTVYHTCHPEKCSDHNATSWTQTRLNVLSFQHKILAIFKNCINTELTGPKSPFFGFWGISPQLRFLSLQNFGTNSSWGYLMIFRRGNMTFMTC
jgi:hypothetical protein